MISTIYNAQQIQELSSNIYVEKCSKRYITFTKECKLEFIKLHKQWEFYRDIFTRFGFPEYIVRSQLPERCSQRWRKLFTEQWVLWFSKKKWRSKKDKKDISKMSLEEQNEYLRAEVAYLRKLYISIHKKSP